jgi:hypothetical protein
MSETVRGDDSMPPTVGSGSSSFEVEALEIYETSSATATDGVLIFFLSGCPWLISRSDIEFNQNYNDDDSLTDEDDDLPSLRDILERKWTRNLEVIDLTVEDDVVGPQQPQIFRDLTLAGLKSVITPVSSSGESHRSNATGASHISCNYSATNSVAYATIKLLYNAHSRYDFFGSPNTEEDTVQKHSVMVSVSRRALANIHQNSRSRCLRSCRASRRDGE